MKYKINLYVTKGCIACDIMDKNINRIIEYFKKCNKPIDIEFNKFDKEYCWNEILKAEGVKDFPTMIFYINDKISFKLQGTHSFDNIKKHIFEVITEWY